MSKELDLSDFLKDASVSDLSWLEVDETAYRAQDHLPKQNLDIKPDLEALWDREGEPASTRLVPNKVMVRDPEIPDPHTMGDMSRMHGPVSGVAQDIAKVARYALIQSSDLNRLRDELVKRFGLEPLRENRTVLAAVLQERGLLGNYYIDANDFPLCANGKANQFVSKYASSAKYVLSKKACGGCRHAQTSPTGGTVCGQFQKEIKVEIPFTEQNAEEVERAQAARGRTASTKAADPKERIRAAYLAKEASETTGVYSGDGLNRVAAVAADPQAGEKLIQASSLIRKKSASEQLAIEAKPVVDFLNREMVKGLTHQELASGLKMAFDKDTLVRTHKHWGPLLSESGLYGVIYTKQASFDDCREGADFLAKHNPGVRAIVAGSKCGSCIYHKVSRCMMYGKPVVKNASEVLNNETVEAVVQEHKLAGRLPYTKTASSWTGSPSEALKAIHAETHATISVQSVQTRMGAQKGFYGNSVDDHHASSITKRNIVKQASRYMNEGLYGEDLLTALSAQFERRDLIAAQAELKVVLAEQGLQGIHYVDPAAYDDYGKGCDEASRLHGSRLVKYAKIGSKCSGCVHQIKLGHCSKLNKQLVAEPPYIDKQAQQREVLASGRSTEISCADIVNNGASMLAEYQMQNPMVVEVDAPVKFASTDIEIGTGKVKL